MNTQEAESYAFYKITVIQTVCNIYKQGNTNMLYL